MRLLWLAVVVGIGSGCATITIGRKIDFEKVRALKVGESTKSSTFESMGKPFLSMPDGTPRGETWIYQYTKARSSAIPLPFHTIAHSDMDQDQIQLRFDGEGVLQSVQGFIPPEAKPTQPKPIARGE